jgi:predicted  nucleic acid-binding Zn-ribbon protein
MRDNERKGLESTIQVLQRNVRELEKQLHDAYKRISELNDKVSQRQ